MKGLGKFLAVAFGSGVYCIAAWITHIVVCFKSGAWGFLIAGAIMPPIGVVHGTGAWFGWW